MSDKTREPQYQFLLDLQKKEGLKALGLMSSQIWRDDPKRLCFLLSRYKFVAKMLSGLNRVLEVGCGDAFGTRVVRKEVKDLVATDFDPIFVKHVNQNIDPLLPLTCKVHDLLTGPLKEGFDGAYALDVLEHIHREDEIRFMTHMAQSLGDNGVCIIGTPSKESQPYASPVSKEGHVNCKTASTLRDLMEKFFHNVFIFSMNDEVVHTGFYPLAHYLIALCCCKKQNH